MENFHRLGRASRSTTSGYIRGVAFAKLVLIFTILVVIVLALYLRLRRFRARRRHRD